MDFTVSLQGISYRIDLKLSIIISATKVNETHNRHQFGLMCYKMKRVA